MPPAGSTPENQPAATPDIAIEQPARPIDIAEDKVEHALEAPAPTVSTPNNVDAPIAPTVLTENDNKALADFYGEEAEHSQGLVDSGYAPQRDSRDIGIIQNPETRAQVEKGARLRAAINELRKTADKLEDELEALIQEVDVDREEIGDAQDEYIKTIDEASPAAPSIQRRGESPMIRQPLPAEQTSPQIAAAPEVAPPPAE